MTRDAGRYHPVAIALHWVIAAGILLQVVLGLAMTQLDLPLAQKFAWFQLHKSIGITVLLAVLLRVIWRISYAPPPLPAGMPRVERAAASSAHLALYLLILALPFSGWALVSASVYNLPTVLYGIVPWPHLPMLSRLTDKAPVESALKWTHAWLAWTMLALLAVHVAAVIRHIARGDGVFARMSPVPSRRLS